MMSVERGRNGGGDGGLMRIGEGEEGVGRSTEYIISAVLGEQGNRGQASV